MWAISGFFNTDCTCGTKEAWSQLDFFPDECINFFASGNRWACLHCIVWGSLCWMSVPSIPDSEMCLCRMNARFANRHATCFDSKCSRKLLFCPPGGIINSASGCQKMPTMSATMSGHHVTSRLSSCYVDEPLRMLSLVHRFGTRDLVLNDRHISLWILRENFRGGTKFWPKPYR